jgi:hypothetical protein
MADFGVYWAFFSKSDEPERVREWCIGSGSRLHKVQEGDRLWLFSSGKKCKRVFDQDEAGRPFEDHLGYLLELFMVKNLKREKRGQFTHFIKAQRCVPFVPPINVDVVFRAEQSNPSCSIGTVRQSVWQLSNFQLERVNSFLSRHHPKVAALL